ncbi:MAG: hypothetical protein ACI3VD_07360 [Candidatus Limivicinus sp.]
MVGQILFFPDEKHRIRDAGKQHDASQHRWQPFCYGSRHDHAQDSHNRKQYPVAFFYVLHGLFYPFLHARNDKKKQFRSISNGEIE